MLPVSRVSRHSIPLLTGESPLDAAFVHTVPAMPSTSAGGASWQPYEGDTASDAARGGLALEASRLWSVVDGGAYATSSASGSATEVVADPALLRAEVEMERARAAYVAATRRVEGLRRRRNIRRYACTHACTSAA